MFKEDFEILNYCEPLDCLSVLLTCSILLRGSIGMQYQDRFVWFVYLYFFSAYYLQSPRSYCTVLFGNDIPQVCVDLLAPGLSFNTCPKALS